MSVDIFPMEPAHLPTLAALESLCFSTPWSESALAEELQSPHAHFAVAVLEGRPVGYMGLHALFDEGAVTNIAVDPACRRRGVATALLAHQIAWCRAQGVTRMTLEVRVSNTPARELYRRFGFAEDGVRPRFYTAPTEDAVLYSLYIQPEKE